MKERPILFSGPMVRAILDGRKTQTRRVVKGIVPHLWDACHNANMGGPGGGPWWDFWAVGASTYRVRCPYGVPGDRLWVRETWKPHSLYAGMKPREMPQSKVFYRADDGYAPSNTPWVPAIHMPRWASRITLEITGVRVERLNDCSQADALAEGSQEPSLVPIIGACWSERDAYAKLWEHINGEGSWAANPWVWVVEFKRAEALQNAAEAA